MSRHHVRTSQSHPLEIAAVSALGGGVVGVTFCPGKHQPGALTGAWARDLALDLDAIKAWGAGVLITLVTPAELIELKVERLGEAARARGLAWLHLPIPDVSTPSAEWERQWAQEREAVHDALDHGGRVVVHCKGGLGRAGTVAALILVERGLPPAEAIAAVRGVRKGALETAAQERYLARPRITWSGGAAQPSAGVEPPVRASGKTAAIRPTSTRGADWFERLTGFEELGWRETRSLLEVEGSVLRSTVNDARYDVGELELVSLVELRARLDTVKAPQGRLRFTNIVGDVRKLHRAPEYAGALFQVASQFNLLEMVGPRVTPEDGVTRYQGDPTQGPACAIAAGAATLYRNYFANVGGERGQTAKRQLNGLHDLGEALSTALERPVEALWTMRNGYALCTPAGLSAISEHLDGVDETERYRLQGLLRIGVHRDVEVTDGPTLPGQHVSQAFCSALPVAYGGGLRASWAPFASLVLEAAYEATLAEATLTAARGGSPTVLLTRLGGGAFGNADAWIDAALKRALSLFSDRALDVCLVSYG